MCMCFFIAAILADVPALGFISHGLDQFLVRPPAALGIGPVTSRSAANVGLSGLYRARC